MRSTIPSLFIQLTVRSLIGLLVVSTITLTWCFGSFNNIADRNRSQASESTASHRSIREYRLDVKTFMKLSKSKDAQTQRNAIFNLCELHWELVTDPRFETNQQVQGFRVVVAKRLDGFVKDFRNQQRREYRKTKAGNADDTDGEPDVNGLAVVDGHENSDARTEQEMYAASSDAYSLIGQFAGGPNQLFGYAGGQLGPPWDHGPELVALIQNTIDPSFWRENGGNGVIHYFKPLRVLVVGATTQVHHETLDLLYKLRAAGQ